MSSSVTPYFDGGKAAGAFSSSAAGGAPAARDIVPEPPLKLASPLPALDACQNKALEYVLFLERADLTREVNAVVHEMCGIRLADPIQPPKAYNRLKALKHNVFPALDGPCWILELSSMTPDNRFTILNDLDEQVGESTARKQVTVLSLIRKNVLYKLLPKENVYVPNADWVAEQERSEVMEGAVLVETVHKPAGAQPQTMRKLAAKSYVGDCFSVMWKMASSSSVSVEDQGEGEGAGGEEGDEGS